MNENKERQMKNAENLPRTTRQFNSSGLGVMLEWSLVGNMVKSLVKEYGLRPMLNAVAAAALEMDDNGEPVFDERGDQMASEDVRAACYSITERDLY